MSNDFQTFADAPGANVISQAAYLALAARLSGFQPGLAKSAEANKVWRQSSFVVSQLAQFIADTLIENVVDDGDTATFLDQLRRAIGAAAGNARIITASANFIMAPSDRIIGLNRTVAQTATQATLPTLPDALAGTLCAIEDLPGTFDQYPVTVVPPAGTISGSANHVLNVAKAAGRYRWYGAGLWSVA